ASRLMLQRAAPFRAQRVEPPSRLVWTRFSRIRLRDPSRALHVLEGSVERRRVERHGTTALFFGPAADLGAVQRSFGEREEDVAAKGFHGVGPRRGSSRNV